MQEYKYFHLNFTHPVTRGEHYLHLLIFMMYLTSLKSRKLILMGLHLRDYTIGPMSKKVASLEIEPEFVEEDVT